MGTTKLTLTCGESAKPDMQGSTKAASIADRRLLPLDAFDSLAMVQLALSLPERRGSLDIRCLDKRDRAEANLQDSETA